MDKESNDNMESTYVEVETFFTTQRTLAHSLYTSLCDVNQQIDNIDRTEMLLFSLREQPLQRGPAIHLWSKAEEMRSKVARLVREELCKQRVRIADHIGSIEYQQTCVQQQLEEF